MEFPVSARPYRGAETEEFPARKTHAEFTLTLRPESGNWRNPPAQDMAAWLKRQPAAARAKFIADARRRLGDHDPD